MLCKDIMKVIETTYPKHAALEWDNVGLLVGRMKKEVRRIYIALDASDEVICDAIEKKADFIITHHPLLFSPLKQVTDEHFIGARVVKLLQHDISYYAMHTNYDILRMAELAGEMMGLTDMIPLEESGVGRVGSLTTEMTLETCCERVKERFGLQAVKVFGNCEKKVAKVAISPGSGKHMTSLAIEKAADVFITAEIDHHEGIDAVAQGTAVIDAGHYGLEHIFIMDMKQYLTEQFDGIEILTADIVHPFQII